MNDDFVGEHGIRLNLVGKTSTGEILNIVLLKQMDSSIEEFKMQKRNNDAICKQIVDSLEATNMYKRSLYYRAKLYSAQLNKKRSYKELCQIITINILVLMKLVA